MKKRVYGLLILGLLMFSGCNLFSGLDKEKLDGNTFDYKLDESMASGDYGTVVSLVNNEIAGNAALNMLDTTIGAQITAAPTWTATNYVAITDSLNNSIADANSRRYIELKLMLAQAQLGLSGLKMTDIIAQLTNATKNKISKSLDNGTIEIGDLIPAGLQSSYLYDAVSSYIMGLPSLPDNYIKDEYAMNYLNGALTSAISSVYRFLVVFTEDPSAETLVWKPYSSTLQSSWNNEVNQAKLEIIAAQQLLNTYGTGSGLIKQDDLDEINSNIDDILNQMTFTDEAGYNTFKATIGY